MIPLPPEFTTRKKVSQTLKTTAESVRQRIYGSRRFDSSCRRRLRHVKGACRNYSRQRRNQFPDTRVKPSSNSAEGGWGSGAQLANSGHLPSPNSNACTQRARNTHHERNQVQPPSPPPRARACQHMRNPIFPFLLQTHPTTHFRH